MTITPENLSIIPLPLDIKWQSGSFPLTPDTVIVADLSNHWNAFFLQNLLTPIGVTIQSQTMESGITSTICLRMCGDCHTFGNEGYRLIIKPNTILIEAAETAGIFYGIQTLRQLLPVEIENKKSANKIEWNISCLEIVDRPRFAWRGYMLDDGRYFHGKENLLRVLDLMAMQKLNVLHWHLTEDQGWRIEIKKYPRLTEIGSKRAGTRKGFVGKHNGIPHAGFYSQDDIREIVEYAAKRHILIVPEIEMPGHSLAALASYPELSCTGDPLEVATHFGIYPDIYCAGKEDVFSFLQDVLDEVMELFPSPYIHIGGDEAPKKRWKRCPDCQKRIHQLGLNDEKALQVYFTNRMVEYLARHGRRTIGWNEILQKNLAESAIVQYWIGNKKALIEAIRTHKRNVVISSYLYLYLDHSYSLTPLSRAYLFEPVFPGLDPDNCEQILGLEALLWSEFVPDQSRLDYQTFPRLTAFAETGWTQREAKNLESFLRRLPAFLQRLDHLDVRFASQFDREPSKIRQTFGILTIAQPQTRTTDPIDDMLVNHSFS